MILEILGYLLGLGFCLSKVYYDIQTVGLGDYRIISTLMPDLIVLASILLYCCKSTKFVSFLLCLCSVGYFYVVLAFNGMGSSILACQASGICEITVAIVCQNLSTNQWIGAMYLFGTGIKIMNSTLLAKNIYSNYERIKIVPN